MVEPVKVEVTYWECECGRLYWRKRPAMCSVCKKSDPNIFRERKGTVDVTPYE